MANLLDYLDWRGDLTLKQSPFNEVDNLILAELAFVDFNGIVPGPGEGPAVVLEEAAERYLERFPAGEKIDMGVLVPDEIPDMVRKMARLPRFRSMRLGCFADRLDADNAQQFAALTVETGDGAVCCSFRGTDDTLAGWKEDFHMAYVSQIPAQKLAVEYLETVARQYPRRKLRLGGHSKGGNLAVWSGVFCRPAVQKRIQAVWSNDGPGFHDDILVLPQYCRLADRITTIVPKSSVVGMLLEHGEDYVVVDSREQGLMQHDGFSWQVLGTEFVHLREITPQGRRTDLALRTWLKELSPEQRERFVEGLFQVLTASGASTLTDLKEDGLKSAGAMVRAMKDLDKETRDALIDAVGLLMRSNVKVLLEDWQQESQKKRREQKKKEDG